jgi:hypothetical protein
MYDRLPACLFLSRATLPAMAKEVGLTSGPALWPPQTGWKPIVH